MDIRKLLVAKRDAAQIHLDNFDKASTFAGTLEPRQLDAGETLQEGAPVKRGRKPKAVVAPVKRGRKPKAAAAEPTAPVAIVKKPRDYAAENARTKERKAAKLAAAAASVDPLA